MKIVVNHPTYGEIVYDESFWTGKKTLTENGATCFAISKKEFMVGDQKALLSGNLFSGIHLSIGQETIEISPRPAWYEIFLAILPLLFLLTWGNSPALCAIFPVVGGAIGGAIGGALGGAGSMLSLILMKNAKPIGKKLLIGVSIFVATLLVSFLLALLVLSAMI